MVRMAEEGVFTEVKIMKLIIVKEQTGIINMRLVKPLIRTHLEMENFQSPLPK